jgi:hypothetical protein
MCHDTQEIVRLLHEEHDYGNEASTAQEKQKDQVLGYNLST